MHQSWSNQKKQMETKYIVVDYDKKDVQFVETMEEAIRLIPNVQNAEVFSFDVDEVETGTQEPVCGMADGKFWASSE